MGEKWYLMGRRHFGVAAVARGGRSPGWLKAQHSPTAAFLPCSFLGLDTLVEMCQPAIRQRRARPARPDGAHVALATCGGCPHAW